MKNFKIIALATLLSFGTITASPVIALAKEHHPPMRTSDYFKNEYRHGHSRSRGHEHHHSKSDKLVKGIIIGAVIGAILNDQVRRNERTRQEEN